MERYHARLELAPRDVVARAVAREGMGASPGESRTVYLDMRHVTGVDLRKRFPGISAFLAQHGLELQRDLIPIRPAAHYLMGGIRVDLEGRTTLRGLYAAGEAACTGLHGANRLASNSLLEGLVFGARAAGAVLTDALEQAPIAALPANTASTAAADSEVETLIARLQQEMAHFAGLLREESLLKKGIAAHTELESALDGIAQRHGGITRRFVEARSLARVARAILRSALARRESRGAHFRSDLPRRDDEHFQKHAIHRGEEPIRFEAW